MNKKEETPKNALGVVNLIASVLIIGVLGIVLTYTFKIHDQQTELKNDQINLLKTNVDMLKEEQVDRQQTKLKSLKEFYEGEIKEKDSNFISNKKALDSLDFKLAEVTTEKYIKSLESKILNPKREGTYYLDTEGVRAVAFLINENKYNSETVKLQDSIITNLRRAYGAYKVIIEHFQVIDSLKDLQLDLYKQRDSVYVDSVNYRSNEERKIILDILMLFFWI